jgi:hypothetical protein
MSRLTLEQKWDVVFPLACAVAAAVERFDAVNTAHGDERALATVLHMARQLRRGVDHVCPDELTAEVQPCRE